MKKQDCVFLKGLAKCLYGVFAGGLFFAVVSLTGCRTTSGNAAVRDSEHAQDEDVEHLSEALRRLENNVASLRNELSQLKEGSKVGNQGMDTQREETAGLKLENEGRQKELAGGVQDKASLDVVNKGTDKKAQESETFHLAEGKRSIMEKTRRYLERLGYMGNTRKVDPQTLVEGFGRLLRPDSAEQEKRIVFLALYGAAVGGGIDIQFLNRLSALDENTKSLLSNADREFVEEFIR